MKKVLLLTVCVLGFACLTACSSDKVADLASTDLTNITLDGIQLGGGFDEINSDNYTLSDRFEERDNTTNFEEWKITVDENDVITRIHANMSDIEISINSNTACKTIDDVVNVLGKDYSSGWYDKEQRLKQHIYIDHDNLLQVNFIYENNSDQLVWVIIEKSG